MTDPANRLEYERPVDLRVSARSTFVAVFALATVIASFVPIWLTYGSILSIPGCIGWLITLICLLSLWKSRRWAVVWALIGSSLMWMNLAPVAAYAVVNLRYLWELLRDWNVFAGEVIRIAINVVAFVIDTITILLLIHRLRRGRMR